MKEGERERENRPLFSAVSVDNIKVEWMDGWMHVGF